MTARFAARSLSDPGLDRYLAERGRTPQAGVWSFDALVLAAFYFSPDLAQARAAWADASGAKVAAAARPNPLFALTPGFDTSPQGGVPPWLLASALDVLIETAGKRHLRMAEASRLLDASAYHAAAVAWRTRSQVRRQLLALFAARRRAEVLQASAQEAASALGLMEALSGAGEATPYEVVQSQAALDQLRAQHRDAEAQAAAALAALTATIGLPAGGLDGVRIEAPDVGRLSDATPTRAARAAALVGRADLLELVARFNASASALNLELARRYPDVQLAPGYQLDLADNKWTLAAIAPLPIFNQNQGPIAQARAQRRLAAARIDALQTAILAQAETAAAQYRAATDKLVAAQALVARQQRQFAVGEAMLAAGEISRLDLAERRLAVGAARLSEDTARAEAEQALAELEDAMQEPAVAATDIVHAPAFPSEARP